MSPIDLPSDISNDHDASLVKKMTLNRHKYLGTSRFHEMPSFKRNW